MLKNVRTFLLAFCALTCATPLLAAGDPSIAQVYEAARTGHLDQAQQMMNQVLQDHPQSAKAHYVAAEIFARAGNSPRARQELDTAQTLAPGLPFASPGAVQALQELERRWANEKSHPILPPGYVAVSEYPSFLTILPTYCLMAQVTGANEGDTFCVVATYQLVQKLTNR